MNLKLRVQHVAVLILQIKKRVTGSFAGVPERPRVWNGSLLQFARPFVEVDRVVDTKPVFVYRPFGEASMGNMSSKSTEDRRLDHLLELFCVHLTVSMYCVLCFKIAMPLIKVPNYNIVIF